MVFEVSVLRLKAGISTKLKVGINYLITVRILIKDSENGTIARNFSLFLKQNAR